MKKKALISTHGYSFMYSGASFHVERVWVHGCLKIVCYYNKDQILWMQLPIALYFTHFVKQEAWNKSCYVTRYPVDYVIIILYVIIMAMGQFDDVTNNE